LPAYLVAERDRGTVRGRPAVAGEAHGDAQAGRGLRQGDGASQRRGELGGAVRALERADALEAPLRLGREGEADDVEVDLEPCPCQALGHGADVPAARLLAVGDEDDELAAGRRP